MSRDWKAAFRYARSLFLLAKEKGTLAEREQEMHGILDFARNHPEFSRLLVTTNLAYSEKEALIENLLGFASEETRSFLKLLVRKNRYPLFERMVEDFHRLFNEAQGIEEALAVSPYPLGQETEEEIKRMLEKK